MVQKFVGGVMSSIAGLVGQNVSAFFFGRNVGKKHEPGLVENHREWVIAGVISSAVMMTRGFAMAWMPILGLSAYKVFRKVDGNVSQFVSWVKVVALAVSAFQLTRHATKNPLPTLGITALMTATIGFNVLKYLFARNNDEGTERAEQPANNGGSKFARVFKWIVKKSQDVYTSMDENSLPKAMTKMKYIFAATAAGTFLLDALKLNFRLGSSIAVTLIPFVPFFINGADELAKKITIQIPFLGKKGGNLKTLTLYATVTLASLGFCIMRPPHTWGLKTLIAAFVVGAGIWNVGGNKLFDYFMTEPTSKSSKVKSLFINEGQSSNNEESGWLEQQVWSIAKSVGTTALLYFTFSGAFGWARNYMPF
jgi:hypothetical protein